MESPLQREGGSLYRRWVDAREGAMKHSGASLLWFSRMEGLMRSRRELDLEFR